VLFDSLLDHDALIFGVKFSSSRWRRAPACRRRPGGVEGRSVQPWGRSPVGVHKASLLGVQAQPGFQNINILGRFTALMQYPKSLLSPPAHRMASVASGSGLPKYALLMSGYVRGHRELVGPIVSVALLTEPCAPSALVKALACHFRIASVPRPCCWRQSFGPRYHSRSGGAGKAGPIWPL